MTTINDAGLALLKRFEGLHLEAYRDPVGLWTIGHGHLIGDGSDAAWQDSPYHGRTLTEAEAGAILAADLAGAEQAVGDLVTVDLTSNQAAACVSLVFNIGRNAFARSTLLRKLNAGDHRGAAAEFPKWRRAGGRVLPGLERRRAAERALFERPDVPEPKPVRRSRTLRGGLAGVTATIVAASSQVAPLRPVVDGIASGYGLDAATIGAVASTITLAAIAFMMWRRWADRRKVWR